MVKAAKQVISPLPVGIYSNSTMRSTQRRYQVNEGKSCLDAGIVWARGALCSSRTKKKLAAKKRQETHFPSKEEKDKWIEDYVERATAGARKRVEDAEAAVQQELEDMKHAEIAELTNRVPKKSFEEMMVAIGDSLCDLPSFDDGENGEN